MRTRLASSTATLACALLLAAVSACSGDPEPIIAPSPSQAPTVTDPSDSPTAAATPEPKPESAKAFIRRWQDETYSMQRSGDPSDYLALTDNCSSCDALAAQVAKIYRDGGSVRIGGGSVSAIRRVGKIDSVLIYEYRVDSKPSQVVDADGNVDSRFTGGTSTFQVNLTQKSATWVVLRVSRLAS